jgi:hypothetical protein
MLGVRVAAAAKVVGHRDQHWNREHRVVVRPVLARQKEVQLEAAMACRVAGLLDEQPRALLCPHSFPPELSEPQASRPEPE